MVEGKVEHAATAGLRRLRRVLILAWAGAWVVGIGLLSAVAIDLSGTLRESDLEAELALHATAAYGLAWFDEEGVFHDELLRGEDDLLHGPVDIWIVEPGSPPVFHLRPPEAVLDPDPEWLAQRARRIVRAQEDLSEDGADRSGVAFRLHGVPHYQDGVDDRARAAILALSDAEPGRAAHRGFVTRILLLALLVGVAGIAVSGYLARWSLRPIAAAFEQRERFLTAAAHELRTPVASLRAVCESGLAGDEPAREALGRATELVARTGDVVQDLLLFARLDAGEDVCEREPLRLDLLLESCLPEDGSVSLEAGETVVQADPRLVRVAARNLIENALVHGGGTRVRMRVDGSSVVVEDDGPGFPAAILSLAGGSFTTAPSRKGAGIGLATVNWIARLHGGALELENPPRGGARAVLWLG